MEFKIIAEITVNIPNKNWNDCETDGDRFNSELDEIDENGELRYLRDLINEDTSYINDITISLSN